MEGKYPPGGRYHFDIPKDSKAIPIIPPKPSIPEPPSQVPGTCLPTPPSSHTGNSTPSSHIAKNAFAATRYTAGTERDDWEFDVYAKPFVPQSLTVINVQRGIPVDTDSNRKINFMDYVRAFAGSGFLPVRPPLLPTPTISEVQTAAYRIQLSESSYQAFLEGHIFVEVRAKEIENQNYALYKIPIATEGSHDLLRLHVPGLREDAPMVEMGDCIQLRELRLDYSGNPLYMEAWLCPGGGASRGLPCPGWTGYEYNAMVFSVNRTQEILLLKVHALRPESMVFNVQFLVQTRRIDALRSAITMAQEYMLSPPAVLTGHTLQGAAADTTSERRSEAHEQTTLRKDWMRRMLFPSKDHAVMQTTLHKIPYRRELFDAKLNFEQLKAVDSIYRNEYGTLPFLISGPPGTGKTKTLVETALQLLASSKASAKVAHILVCAPSDPAADTLALRLREHLEPHQLLRLNGPSRSFPEVPSILMSYCYIEADTFYIPPMPTLMKYDIVVTTCRDAAMLVSGRVTNHDLYSLESGLQSVLHPENLSTTMWMPHWGALLMDEAAQAIEPETLIPLTVIAPPPIANVAFDPQFVMAGDHKQLGPRTASKSPAIQTSLFERLFKRSLFAEHPLSRNNTNPSAPTPVLTNAMLPIVRPPFTNLTRNYRSHPSILAIPSSLFYHDTLIPEATNTDSLLSWDGWRGRRWPVLFACNAGLDEIERDGGGWYNLLEAQMACDYALDLYKTGEVMQKDICIMSPFSAQVKQLRTLIRQAPYQLWDVNIGPAEAFQGLESRVVILCTTRTRPRFLTSDASRALGLVNMPKRMNVALTRAKHGLIVIGHPEVLTKDDHWTAFLAFCARNGLWQNQIETGGLKAQEEWLESLKTRGTIGELERQLLRKEERGGDADGSGSRRVLGAKGRTGGEEMYDHDDVRMIGEAVEWENREEVVDDDDG